MAKIRKKIIRNLTSQAYSNLKNRKDNIFLLNRNSVDDLINKMMSRCLIAFEQIMNNKENTRIVGQRIFERCNIVINDVIKNFNFSKQEGLKNNLIHQVVEYLFVLKELRGNNFYNNAKFIVRRKELLGVELNSFSIYWNFLTKEHQFNRFFTYIIRNYYKKKISKLLNY